MKLPIQGSLKGTIYVLQSRVTKVTKYDNPKGELGCPRAYCGGTPTWHISGCNWILYRPDESPEYKQIGKELSLSYGRFGVNGFRNKKTAKAAKKIMETLDDQGCFDDKDGYSNLLYRVRKEYRIVKVSVDTKVEAI